MSAEKDDELMAVLLGDPPPDRGESARERHTAAARDMAAVREQLRRVGDGLAREAAGRARREPAPRRRRTRLLLFALAASVAVVLLGTGTAYLVARDGSADGGTDALLTHEGLIACSSAVAEGTVTRIEPAGGNDRYRIVLNVDRHYKPSDGERELIFTDEGADVPAYYRAGVRVLVLIPSTPGEGPESYRAGDPPGPGHGARPTARDALEEGRLQVERALPGSRDLECDGRG
ncbi:hypothetical protein ACFVIN_05080 [Streptomyces prasinus]|uniref:hypothetical protein n=1 Tax=Streptomyces prasinus TaxID=67345 RepID=UPI00331C3B12